MTLDENRKIDIHVAQLVFGHKVRVFYEAFIFPANPPFRVEAGAYIETIPVPAGIPVYSPVPYYSTNETSASLVWKKIESISYDMFEIFARHMPSYANDELNDRGNLKTEREGISALEICKAALLTIDPSFEFSK